jgi:hypothetical protein
VFQYQATGGTPLTAKSTGANGGVAFGLAAFYVQLAMDAKNCDLSSSGEALVTNAAIIKKFVGEAGDTTYAVGTLTAPSGGATGSTSGVAYFAGFSSAPGLTNSALLNTADTASGALLCGGPAAVGHCAGEASTLLCTSSDLNTGKNADPNNLTNCSLAGQTLGANGTSTVASFVYPLAGAVCKGEVTLAECCKDPKLVIITHTLEIPNDGTTKSAPSYVSIVTDQGTGGYATAWIQ